MTKGDKHKPPTNHILVAYLNTEDNGHAPLASHAYIKHVFTYKCRSTKKENRF
jgi:hypothetical protein